MWAIGPFICMGYVCGMGSIHMYVVRSIHIWGEPLLCMWYAM